MDEQQREKNYLRIVNTVEHLKNDGHISEDWMEEHKSVIQFYREITSDWNMINPDVIELDFRNSAYKVEILLRFLTKEIKVYNYFNVKLYLELNQKLLYMINYFDGIDELTNELLKLSM